MKWKTIMACTLAMTLTFGGCGAASQISANSGESNNQTERTSENTEKNTQEVTEDTAQESQNETTDENSSAETEVENSETTDFSEEDQFTERDLSGDYDKNDAIAITLADNGATTSSNSVSIDGTTVTITEEGTYLLSGTCSDGMIIVDADKSAKIQLVLNGITLTSKNSAAIYIKQADKVFLTLASGTQNTLSSGSSYVAIDENNIDAAIFSKEDLTLNGTGSLTVQSPAGHGIVSKDDLVFASGSYSITSEKDAISGKDSVRIANGNFTIKANDDGIRSGKEEGNYIYLCGGTFQIDAASKGLGAWLIYITDGTIDISNSKEGMEAQEIHISGGEVDITSSDDGMNATSTSENSSTSDDFKGGMFEVDENAGIYISGGIIHISAEGDGLDSNGSITVTGGETYVTGPTNSGNGSLDYNGEAVITDGIFVTAGASGMAQNFSSSSAQGSILVSTGSQSAGSTIQLLDSSGKSLLEWTSDKSFDSVLISMPEIKSGQTYTLKAGNYSEEITMNSLIYGEGNGMGGGRMNGGDMRGQMDGDMRGQMDGDMRGQMNGGMRGHGRMER